MQVEPNASQCNSANDIRTEVPEETEGKVVTDVPQIFAIEYFGNELNDLYDLNVGKNLSHTDAEQLRKLVNERYLRPTAVLVEPLDYEMKIRLTSDVPFHCLPRRLSYLEKTETQRTVDQLLQEGIIRPSDSPYASQVVLVKKKNGKSRMCINYKGLNRLTIRDNYPLSLIEDCVEYLEGERLFTVLDLKSGFHQVKVAEDSIKYTAFVTPSEQYEYVKMPFGLKNGPAVFQRFVNTVFRDLIDDGLIIIYMDDLVLATEDFEEHRRLLTIILERPTKRGLQLNLEKCQFGFEAIEYLGYLVTDTGITPSDSHIAAIQKYPRPNNIRAVHSCLGLFNYFRRFVPQFSKIARPLQNLTHKDAVSINAATTLFMN